MKAAWRLSINGLAGRRSRTAFLVAAVALSTALVAAVACAMASLSAGMEARVTQALGASDVRVRHISEERFDARVLDLLRDREVVDAAAPRLRAPLSLRARDEGATVTVVGVGIDPRAERLIVEPAIAEGRAVQSPGEVVLNPASAEELAVAVGDTVSVARFGEPITLTVVGLSAGRAIELVARPEAVLDRAQLEEISGYRGALSEIQVALAPGVDPQAFAETLQPRLPEDVTADPTTLVTSGLDDAAKANQFVFILASVLAYIAAAFIVLTGLTTNMLERRRELAIMRAIGATPATLATGQFGIGAVIGVLGALAGLPLGVFLAWIMTALYPERLPAGLVVEVRGIAIALAGSLAAGLFGATWPAISAARTTPLESLSVRAVRPSPAIILLVSALGVAGVGAQALVITLNDDGQQLFWRYATFGLPAMFVGYFFLGVPVCAAIRRIIGPALARALAVPPGLLLGSMRGTPFRHGFTAGALMVGLAMLVATWTNGRAILDDWLGSIDFPEAFVRGLIPLPDDAQQRLEDLPFIDQTCAVTLERVEDDTFGVRFFSGGIGTTFVAFEPGPLLEMTELHWVEGDPETALPKLEAGGAVLVAKEFTVAGGLGVGDTFRTTHKGGQLAFEIVGVVSSPGLDLVNKYFDIGKEYANQAVHSVFGSRKDLRRYFGTDRVDLIQLGVDADIPDDEVVRRVREALPGVPMVVGSGREIMEGIREIGRGTMHTASVVAIFAMLIGCLGVGNIMIAGIDARRFELGVLRSIGATRGVVARLLAGEAIVIALAACVLGTGMGLQGAWAGLKLNRLLAGLELSLRVDAWTIAWASALLVLLVLLTVAPIIRRVAVLRPRVLIASARG